MSREILVHADLRAGCSRTCGPWEDDDAPTVKPQKAILELRRAMAPEDVLVSDVGAHKIWVARLFQAYEPNTVIISNGFASMGIALPGAIAAALVHPDRRVVALCGDGGLLMNVQELETAVRLRSKVTVVVWRDDGYGLIDWKQRNEFGRPFGVEFGNPDFVDLARSFGMPAFRPTAPPAWPRASARPSPSTARRSSRSRSTTARTCASPSGSGRSPTTASDRSTTAGATSGSSPSSRRRRYTS